MSKIILEKSKNAFDKAQSFIPGGVNSPVRAFGAVGGTPIFIKSGAGCRLTDVDGNTYVDYVGSWGPLILGHAEPRIVKRFMMQSQTGRAMARRLRRRYNWRN